MEELKKAVIEVVMGERREPIHVLFNPSEYSFERTNTYKTTQVPGLSTPLLQFINGECDTLSMELFLDDYTDPNGPMPPPPGGVKSVKERLRELFALLLVDRTLHAPPVVTFTWGEFSFRAVIEKMSRKVTLFRPDGTPARATVAVTFKEHATLEDQLTNPRRESSDKSKRRQIIGLDSVYLLAAREFGNVNEWREIANANDLDDPRDVTAGDWLLVPPLESKNGSGSRL